MNFSIKSAFLQFSGFSSLFRPILPSIQRKILHRKYISDVKFSAESNLAGRIGLNSEEKSENCKNALFIEKFITQKHYF